MSIGNLSISSFKMKKFVLRLIVFFIPVFAFIAVWENGLSRMQNSYSLKREQLEAQAQGIQVLVLGPSHALRGVDPDCFSMKGYNAAEIQQSLYYDTRITLKYLDKMTSLKVVLMDISYPSLWYQIYNGPEPFRDYFYDSYWNINYPGIKWYDIRKYSKILQYGNDSAWAYALRGFNDNLTRGYLNNGWAIRGKKGKINDSMGYARVKSQEKEMIQENFETNVNDITMLLNELNKRKIKLIFFTPPFTGCYTKFLDEKRWIIINKTLNELCVKYNSKWFDYHNDLRFSDSDFRDDTHLNKDGAIKFSKIIDEEILKKTSY